MVQKYSSYNHFTIVTLYILCCFEIFPWSHFLISDPLELYFFFSFFVSEHTLHSTDCRTFILSTMYVNETADRYIYCLIRGYRGSSSSPIPLIEQGGQKQPSLCKPLKHIISSYETKW